MHPLGSGTIKDRTGSDQCGVAVGLRVAVTFGRSATQVSLQSPVFIQRVPRFSMSKEFLVASLFCHSILLCCQMSLPALREVQTGTTAADRGVCASGGGCGKRCISKAPRAEEAMGELLNHGPQVLIQVITFYQRACSKSRTESIQGS